MYRMLIRELSNFHVNKVVKAYIIADTILWSAWNLFNPILAVYVVYQIKGGNIELAAGAYSAHLITRVIFELACARLLIRTTDRRKFEIACIGIICMSFAYLGFALSSTLLHIVISYCIAGLGIGIATPAKNALFSTHLDKNREATEWGITDAIAFICIAAATAIGGVIAKVFGFQVLFLLACILNLVSILPFATFLPFRKTLFPPSEAERT